MGKQGPCRHCGVTSTPLWRNGPPEKPVLCNACGSRWRTKGSLANYTPIHAREGSEHEEFPKLGRPRTIASKLKEHLMQKPPKTNEDFVMRDSETFCGQNFQKKTEIDMSNRSSSGSAISISESVHCRNADASDLAGSAQSAAWDTHTLVPSKKRTCVTRTKPSPIHKLAKELYCIMQEQQYSQLSTTSEDDLIYQTNAPIGSFETAYGSALINRPLPKLVEEESEATSFPIESKSSLTSGHSKASKPISLSAASNGINNLRCGTHALERLTAQVSYDGDERERNHLDSLRNEDALLMSLHLEDVLNFESFSKSLTADERELLLQHVTSVDLTIFPESIKNMFDSSQFLENLHSYQELLAQGIVNAPISGPNSEEWTTLNRLVLTDHVKSKWVVSYSNMKGKSFGKKESFVAPVSNAGDNWTSLKRTHESLDLSCPEPQDTLRRVKQSRETRLGKSPSNLMPTEAVLDLFTAPSDWASRSSTVQYTSNSTHQVLVEAPRSDLFHESELLIDPEAPASLVSEKRNSIADGNTWQGGEAIQQPISPRSICNL